jgi:hypothetical protein
MKPRKKRRNKSLKLKRPQRKIKGKRMKEERRRRRNKSLKLKRPQRRIKEKRMKEETRRKMKRQDLWSL